MAGRAAKLKAPSGNGERNALIAALRFAAVAIDKGDNSGLSAFVAIRNKWLIAENETFSVGIAVDTELEICIKAEPFLAALNQCGDNFQMTQLTGHELSVKSGNFRAVIPILSSEIYGVMSADPMIAPLNVKLNEAFRTCTVACSGKGDRVIEQSVLLRASSMVATNGHLMLEHWHGNDMPCPLAIPKKTADTINKLEKTFAGFGYSPDRSATFYFEDGSYIKTRLMSQAWPDVDKLFTEHFLLHKFEPMWKGFADALSAVAKFVEEDTIQFHNGTLSTHGDLEHAAASYAVANLPGRYAFSASYWRVMLPFADQVFVQDKGKPFVILSNDGVRGLIMGKNV